MNRIAHLALALVAALSLSLAGCSDAAEPAPLAEQSQEAIFTYTAANGSTTVGLNATRFGHAIYFGAGSGHAGSPTWPSGAAKQGAAFGAGSPAITAFPYDNALGGAVVTSQFDDFSNFGFGAAAGHSDDANPDYLLWSTAYGSAAVSGSIALWGTDSICYLNGLNSLSGSTEYAMIYTVGSTWYLGAGGIPTIGATAKCVYPNRSWTFHGVYSASNGQSVSTGLSSNTSLCFFSKIVGNVDDGIARFRKVSGVWFLDNVGLSTVEAFCATFP
jgi:hypothetical protein